MVKIEDIYAISIQVSAFAEDNICRAAILSHANTVISSYKTFTNSTT